MATIIVRTAMVALLIGFSVKVTQSVLKYMDGKVARSTSNIFERYVKFPTISICVGIDSAKATVGFEDTGTRPLNATLDELEFVRHLENGYKLNIIQRSCRRKWRDVFFRSNVPIEVKGSSLHIQEGYFKGQGFKIGVHGMANFYGQCMDFTIVDKTPFGVLNKV